MSVQPPILPPTVGPTPLTGYRLTWRAWARGPFRTQTVVTTPSGPAPQQEQPPG